MWILMRESLLESAWVQDSSEPARALLSCELDMKCAACLHEGHNRVITTQLPMLSCSVSRLVTAASGGNCSTAGRRRTGDDRRC